MKLTPFTIVTVSQGLARTKDYTWAGLGFAIGPKDPLLAKITKVLESGDVFDMGGGVLISTKWETSPHHLD